MHPNAYLYSYRTLLDGIPQHSGIRKGTGPRCIYLTRPLIEGAYRCLPVRPNDSRSIFDICLACPNSSGQHPIPGYRLEGGPRH